VEETAQLIATAPGIAETTPRRRAWPIIAAICVFVGAALVLWRCFG
jgi:hypothetical protein